MVTKSKQETYDVIVVGGGNAGLVAALSACVAGAKVLLLEKAPYDLRGGNTYYTGGGYRFTYEPEGVSEILPDLSEAERRSVTWEGYTPDQFYSDIMRVTQGLADPELTEIVVQESLPTVRWLLGHGIRRELRLEDAAARGGQQIHISARTSWARAKGGGAGLSDRLFEAVEKRGAEVVYGTKAAKLLVDRRGTVCGVTAKDKEGFRDITAKAVILACGGFEANREMRLKYLGPEWEMIPLRGTRYNAGDGLRMALEIGAKPAGHWGGCHAAQVDINHPDIPDKIGTDENTRSGYQMGIMVNVEGRRFVDEGEDWRPFTYTKFGRMVNTQPRRMAFQIFDSRMDAMLSGRYHKGTCVKAEAVEELAVNLEIDPETLAQEVAKFNAAAKAGGGVWDLSVLDGKHTMGILPPKSNWALELDHPPFVAYPTKAAITYSFGGVKINRRAQVLDAEDEVIPGLYAAGEMVGFWYHAYVGGAGLMAGAVFGKIAGAAAAGL